MENYIKSKKHRVQVHEDKLHVYFPGITVTAMLCPKIIWYLLVLRYLTKLKFSLIFASAYLDELQMQW